MRLSLSMPIALACCLALTACDQAADVNQEPVTTTEAAPAPAATAEAPAETATAEAAPAAAAEATSDAEALSEEELDRLLAENSELTSRATDLKEQVNDGQVLLALKEKQIKELEEKIKALKQP